MIGSERKLSVLLDNAELAGLLTAGGYFTPRQIKAATNEELRAVPGIGPAKMTQIRAMFPRA